MRILVPSVFFLALIGVEAIAQTKTEGSPFGVWQDDVTITPRAELPIYAGKPSRLGGNFFNASLGTIVEGQSFEVIWTETFPNFSGGKVGVELLPKEGGQTAQSDLCGQDGCWAFLGSTEAIGSADIAENIIGNFSFEEMPDS